MMLVMLLWMYIHTGKAWRICLSTVHWAKKQCYEMFKKRNLVLRAFCLHGWKVGENGPGIDWSHDTQNFWVFWDDNLCEIKYSLFVYEQMWSDELFANLFIRKYVILNILFYSCKYVILHVADPTIKVKKVYPTSNIN
jgi:hypothetical protein